MPQGKPRALLALLLLHANEVMPLDRLVDELWGERPPPTAGKATQNYVSQLRKVLASAQPGKPNGPLATQGHGYVLRVDPDELDTWRFGSLVDEGRRALVEGDAKRASETLRRALAIWRGPPLADVMYEPFAQTAIGRLEELRLEAVEERIEADLALGRHAALVPELDQLVREHPLRERLRGQLMLALYRSGRQADALAVYHDARTQLLETLGLDPGRPLRELQRAILSHDPGLDLPAPRRPTLARTPRRGRIAVAAGAVLLAGGIAAAAFQLVRGGEPAGLAEVRPGAVGLIEGDSGRIAGQVEIAGRPELIAASPGMVWVTTEAGGAVVGIDAETKRAEVVVAPGVEPGALAFGAGSVWLVDRGGRTLVEIDDGYGEVAQTIELPPPPPGGPAPNARIRPGVAVGFGAVWVTDGSSRLVRVDPASGTASVSVDADIPLDAVSVGERAVWAVSGETATAIAVDPRRNEVTARIPIVGDPDAVSPFPFAVAVGRDFVWTLNANTATVTKIDPELRGVVATIPIGVGRAPAALAAGDGAVWVANAGDGTVSRIDTGSNAVRTTRVGHAPAGLALAGGLVWVSVQAGESAHPEAVAATPTEQSEALVPLPLSRCSRVAFDRPGVPDVLIASNLPLQGFFAEGGAQMNEAVRFALARREFQAGRFTVGFQACDESAAANGGWTPEACESIAEAYAANARLVGVVGPLFSGCAQALIPVLNRGPGGPLVIVGFSNTYVGLTREGVGVEPGEPERYYPTGRRNYVRVIAADDVQAAADAVAASRLRLRAVYVLDDGSAYGTGLATAFEQAAGKLGVGIAGRATWDPSGESYATLARRVAAGRPDGVFLAGALRPASPLLYDLRRELGDTKLLGGDGLQAALDQTEKFGRAAEGLMVSVAGLPFERLGPAGQEFVRDFGRIIGRSPRVFSVYAAQATEVLLDAIASSTGTRASVTHHLLETRVNDGILGTFGFTSTGDITARAVTIYEVRGGRRTVWAVITPSMELVSTG